MKDCMVIEAFIASLRDHSYPDLCIDQKPEKENRQPKDIDALAGLFAIEHTLIPTYQNQKAQDDWFNKALAKLESELPIPPYELIICSGYDAVKKEQDWSAIRNALKTWITQEVPQLTDGEYVLDSPEEIPFPLRIEKSRDGSPGIIFQRRPPENNDSLPSRIKEHLIRKGKIAKLVKYKKTGFTTVLLIEGNLTRNKMLHAIKSAFPAGLHPDLDEIWYVSTWGDHIINFQKLPTWGLPSVD